MIEAGFDKFYKVKASYKSIRLTKNSFMENVCIFMYEKVNFCSNVIKLYLDICTKP